jgi:hypothetical protein
VVLLLFAVGCGCRSRGLEGWLAVGFLVILVGRLALLAGFFSVLDLGFFFLCLGFADASRRHLGQGR